MQPASVFFHRAVLTAHAAAFLLFCASAHAEDAAFQRGVFAEIQSAEVMEPSAEHLPPDEIIFESMRKKALEADKENLLEQFLKNSPGSRFAGRARETIDDIRYRRCRAEDTMRGYTAFIANNPDSRHAAEAAERADDLLFLSVSRENTIEGYTLFIETFPKHPLVPAAQAAIEDLIFDEVKTTESIIAWAEFLRDHAASERSAEALALKDDLEYEPYREKDIEEGYREFLRGFPVNSHRGEAYIQMMALRTARVKRETDAICDEAKMEGSYSCDFVAFEEGTLRVAIVRLSDEEQGQHLLMGGPGYAEEALRRYSAWKNETIKRLLRILGVISVTVE